MKNILQSKTFWVAIAQFIAGGLAVLASNHPNIGWLLIGKSFLDIILRWYTDQPVNFTGNE